MAYPRRNRASRLTGINPLSYLGVDPITPPDLVIEARIPTPNDTNYSLGTFWIFDFDGGVTTPQRLFILMSLVTGVAQWVELINGSAGNLEHLTADDGNIAYPLIGNINILGDGQTIETEATIPNTITIRSLGQPGFLYQTQSGVARPDPTTGVLKVLGGLNINTRAGTTGALVDIIYFDLYASPIITGTLTAGGVTITSTGLSVTGPTALDLTKGVLLSDDFGNITSSVGTLDNQVLVWSQSAGTLTWQAVGGGGGGASSFPTNTGGPATPTVPGALTIVGDGTLLTTDGGTPAGNTVTISMTKSTSGYIPMAQGAAVPVWGHLVGAGGITITPGSGIITITGGGPGPGGGIVQITTDHLAAAEDGANNINLLGTVNQVHTDATVANTVTLTLSATLVTPGTLTVNGLGLGAVVSSAAGLLSSVAIGTAGQALLVDPAGTGFVWGTVSGSGASFFITQNGTASVVGGNIVINGGANINTTGGNPPGGGPGDVVVNLNDAVVLPLTGDTGTGFNVYTGILAIGIDPLGTAGLPGDRFLHSYGTGNTFCGHQCSNFTLTTATAINNSSLGTNTLLHLTTGHANTVAGAFSGDAITTGSTNSLYGYNSGTDLTSGGNNTIVGSNAFTLANIANNNTVLGSGAGTSIVNASSNILIGYQAGSTLTSGSGNVILNGGGNYTGAETNNILITSAGIAAESHAIHIGDTAGTKCYIGGIAGVTITFPQLVVINGVNQLGTVASLPVSLGGTGVTSFSPAYGTVYVGPTQTTLLATATGTAGQVLTSNGNAAAPSYQDSVHRASYAFEGYVAQTIPAATGDGTIYILGAANSGDPQFPLTVINNEGGSFYPGDGNANPAKYTAADTGVYSITLVVQFGNIISSGYSPLHIYLYNSGNVLKREYQFQSTPIPNLVPGPGHINIVSENLTANILMNATDYLEFGASWTEATPSRNVSINGNGSTILLTIVSGFYIGP